MPSAARLQAAGLTATTVLTLVTAISMLQPLATDLYLPSLPGLATAFATDVATVQWTLSIFVAGFGAWQLVAGPLSDRYGRVPVILGGLAVFCAASALCLSAATIEVLIGGRLLQAIGACSVLVGMRGFVRDLYNPTDGARLLATAATLMSVAPLLGPPLGALAFQAFGWRSAFALLGAFSLVLLALCALKLRETNRHRNPHALRPGPMLSTYAAALRSPAFRAYTLASTASYAGLFAYLSGSSFVLVQVLGLSAPAYGLCLSATVLGYMGGTLLCRRWVPRAGLQRTIQRGAVIQCASGLTMAALALAGVAHPAAIVGPFFGYSIAHGLIQPSAQSGAVAPFPHSAGAAAAMLGFVMMAVASLIGFWIGASFDGSTRPLALTIGATTLGTLAIAFVLVRRDGDVSHHG